MRTVAEQLSDAKRELDELRDGNRRAWRNGKEYGLRAALKAVARTPVTTDRLRNGLAQQKADMEAIERLLEDNETKGGSDE